MCFSIHTSFLILTNMWLRDIFRINRFHASYTVMFSFFSICVCVCIGYQREEFNNPADFFLDITNGDIVPTLDSNNAGLDCVSISSASYTLSISCRSGST